MQQRRYDEAEVQRIIEVATTQQLTRPSSGPSEGLTLSDLQSIAAEVGVDPSAIARAAAALDAGISRPSRKSLGMPIEVTRVIPLRRAPTDEEWGQLVAELRATFEAQGRVTVQGGLREWTNGNLHAVVEPSAEGYRLRMGTMKGDATGVNAVGFTGLAAGALVFVSMLVAGDMLGAVIVPTIFGAAGLTAFLTNMVRLPRWAKQRAGQMEHIADRVTAMIEASDGE